MLLYVFKDGRHRQVEGNPTVLDIIALTSGILQIYKLDSKQGYVRLVKDEQKLIWVPITKAKAHTCSEGRLHQ